MIGPAGPEKHATCESTATSPGPEVPDQGEVDAPNLQPETPTRGSPTLAEASTAPRGKSTTKDVAEGWHPPPDPSPVAAQETANVTTVASAQPPEPPPRLSHVEFNELQSRCPIELTPFGRLGKHAQHAVASLHHWNDRAMVQDRLTINGPRTAASMPLVIQPIAYAAKAEVRGMNTPTRRFDSSCFKPENAVSSMFTAMPPSTTFPGRQE